MRDLYFYHELEDMYEERLNECYEAVSICGMNYDQGHALRNLDPVDEIRESDMTEAEIEHYMPIDNTVMYCRKDDNNIDEEE